MAGTRAVRGRASPFTAAVVMVVISLALFFLPLVNGLIGGMVGGYMAGGVRRGLVAAVLPAVFVSVVILLALAFFELPLLGLFAGVAGGVLVLLADVGLFLGAAIGGALARSGGSRRMTA